MLKIAVSQEPDGLTAYAVGGPPASLPEVPPAALFAVWESARAAAAGGRWGTPRRLVFATAAGPMSILLADRDACCWAAAVDRSEDLGTPRGMALCLRLLALVDAMGRLPAGHGLFTLSADGADLHPALLRAAARLRLDAAARFDIEELRQALPRALAARKDTDPMRALRCLALLLPLAACAGPAPLSSPDRARADACRAEATRLVQFRDRGQLMRTDEAESRLGTFSATPSSRLESERAGQTLERERLTQDCLRQTAAPVR